MAYAIRYFVEFALALAILCGVIAGIGGLAGLLSHTGILFFEIISAVALVSALAGAYFNLYFPKYANEPQETGLLRDDPPQFTEA